MHANGLCLRAVRLDVKEGAGDHPIALVPFVSPDFAHAIENPVNGYEKRTVVGIAPSVARVRVAH